MTCLLTANIGSIDPIQGMPRQTVDCDFKYYTENNLPYPMPNLDNRLKSKYIKIQSHKFISCDKMIWIDGRVKIISKSFVEAFTDPLNDHDVVIFRHPERITIGEEMEYIIGNMNKGNHYLLSRYGNQQMEKEYELYKDSNNTGLPLYACTIFARNVNEKTNAVFNDWWEKCLQYSYFDQTMFSFVSQSLKIKVLDMKDWVKQVRINKHLL